MMTKKNKAKPLKNEKEILALLGVPSPNPEMLQEDNPVGITEPPPNTSEDSPYKYIRTEFLDEVSNLLLGERTSDYGDPAIMHERISMIWKVLFPEREWSAYDVAVAMAGMKLARLAEGYHRDSLRDLIGYSAIAEEISQTSNE